MSEYTNFEVDVKAEVGTYSNLPSCCPGYVDDLGDKYLFTTERSWYILSL